LTSQPLLFTPSQSAYPDAHVIEQDPPEHTGVPFELPQTVPHAPQWLVLVVRFTSHPSPADALQSPHPDTQV
jgi:hypothetical protein